jgi:hypothetical protein
MEELVESTFTGPSRLRYFKGAVYDARYRPLGCAKKSRAKGEHYNLASAKSVDLLAIAGWPPL